jgi:hypothetical protein
MPTEKLPATYSAQMFAEAPQTVTAHVVGDRAVLTFGDDVRGVRFMGDRDELWNLIGKAGRALNEATGEEDR